MDRDLYERAGAVFLRAVRLEGEARAELVARACGADGELRRAVELLLAGDGAGTGPLDRPLPLTPREVIGADPPQAIGPYRVLREVGRGGMGRIYLAERSDASFHQEVAIKVLHPGLAGPALVQRFRSERQILADLDHPNIARLIDGGSLPDGSPYLVMEYVEGEPIDLYCDRRALSIEQRLRLFCAVCSAVQVAHQSLVVHRDLKPSNVLVDAGGRPKLLDFGIAKLLEPERADFTVARTCTNELLLTPEYASPEQVRGEPITTASDVYSLGVLLFRLLTGHSPYRLAEPTPIALQAAVRELDPPRPSTVAEADASSDELARQRGTRPGRLRRRLAGDLDNIVLTALRKEPRRRYASALQLAEDVERHLEGRPVSARPDTWTYRAGKFCRRNGLAVGTLALLVLSLVAFGVTSAVQARHLERQRILAGEEAARASLEADTSRDVADFLAELFEASNPVETGGGEPVTALDLLDRGRRRIDALADRPAIQARLLDTIGRSYQFLGRNDQALPLLERAVALCEELHGPASVEVAEPLHRVAKIRFDRGELETSLAMYERVLAIHEAQDPPDERKLAESHNNLALPLTELGRLPEAFEHLRACVSLHEAQEPEDPEALALGCSNLASVAYRLGRIDETLRYVERALGYTERLPADSHTALNVVTTAANLLNEVGRRGEAERLLERAAERTRELFGEQSPLYLDLLEDLAYVREYAGRLDEAVELLQRAVALCRVQGREVRLAELLTNLGKDLRRVGRLDEAEERLSEALEVRFRTLPEPTLGTAKTLVQLGLVHDARGDGEQGDEAVSEALAIAADRAEAPSPALADLQETAASHYEARGDVERALELLTEALDTRRTLLGDADPEVADLRRRVDDLLDGKEAARTGR